MIDFFFKYLIELFTKEYDLKDELLEKLIIVDSPLCNTFILKVNSISNVISLFNMPFK